MAEYEETAADREVKHTSPEKTFRNQLYRWLKMQNQMAMLVNCDKCPKQLSCDRVSNSWDSQNIHPKLRTVELLVADFLVQNDLIFTLCVFASEVPSLHKIGEFSQYIRDLMQSGENFQPDTNVKPHFAASGVKTVFTVLGFNPTCQLVQQMCKMYESRSGALLQCILDSFPTFTDYYCSMEKELVDTKEKEGKYEEIICQQKECIEELNERFTAHEDALHRHRDFVEKSIAFKRRETDQYADFLKEYAKKLAETEQQLKQKEDTLNEKEKELREKETVLVSARIEVDEDYHKLKMDAERFENEKERLEQRMKEMESKAQTFDDVQKHLTEKYEQKLRVLHEELIEIHQKLNTDDCTFVRSVPDVPQPKTEQYTIKHQLADTVKLLQYERERRKRAERELKQLKSLNVSRNDTVTRIIEEFTLSRQKLEMLQKEVLKIKKEKSDSNNSKVCLNRANLSHIEELYYKIISESKLPSNRENLKVSLSDNTSKESSYTDDIIEEAKRKLQELENESQLLNRNFETLQSALSKNFSLERSLRWSSVGSVLSPNQSAQHQTHGERSSFREYWKSMRSKYQISPHIEDSSSDLSCEKKYSGCVRKLPFGNSYSMESCGDPDVSKIRSTQTDSGKQISSPLREEEFREERK